MARGKKARKLVEATPPTLGKSRGDMMYQGRFDQDYGGLAAQKVMIYVRWTHLYDKTQQHMFLQENYFLRRWVQKGWSTGKTTSAEDDALSPFSS